MCGITGQLTRSNSDIDLTSSTKSMIEQLTHRGPDDMGIWKDESSGICLAHRRLSILDLSPHGHQPMCSADGRFIIAFNGEIYNHVQLRKELEDVESYSSSIQWRGRSDTEVMLAAISHWGVYEATKRFTGMFSFALWDRNERSLYLVRDRVGEKPLYFGWVGETLLFGSELKALRSHPNWRGEIDRDALALYMQFNYIPAPYTIYKSIKKLEPGCIAKISENGSMDDVELQRYWSLQDMVVQPRQNISDTTAIEQTESILSATVKRQMVADVPLGAFLSGGVDSSLIVALMQNQSIQPIHTFTIGFHETSFNEADHAAAVAHHLGTEHTEFYVSPQDAMNIIPLLPTLYDEPFADASQIPTYLLSKLTRDHVTVSLSGDGGDELFGGYNRYSWGCNMWDRIKYFPLPLRQVFAALLYKPSPSSWDKLFSIFGFMLPNRFHYSSVGDKIHKLAKLAAATSANDVFFELISLWKGTDIVLGSKTVQTLATDPSRWPSNLDFTEFMMYQDTQSYLPDDILTKVDRASMAVGLESRAPFLDHQFIELAWSLPRNMKIRNTQGKWLLRQILHKYVPRDLIERPKMGFAVPIGDWIRGPLRDWGEELLDESRIHSEGYLEAAPIRKKWNEHLSGKRNWQHHLWGVLMFQAWLDI